jgi:hypothetical protein
LIKREPLYQLWRITKDDEPVSGLNGLYTTVSVAQRAIDDYLKNIIRKTRNGNKTTNNNKTPNCENGTRIVQVPLDDKGRKYAIVDELMFQDLIDLGLSPIWRAKNDRNRDRVVIWNRTTNQDTAIARVLMDAGRRQSVVHANGDPLDLRTNNLVLGAGKGTRRDREDIKPSPQFNYKTIVNREYINNNNNKEMEI